MDRSFRLWPESASTVSGQVDMLFLFLMAVIVFFTLLIFVFVVYFGLKYRRRPGVVPQPVKTDFRLELAWSAIPFLLTLVMFAWGAVLYVDIERPPKDAMQIDVVAKQWMWKTQHPTGQREIDSLHVPINRPIKLQMISQDVIHSFYIPAFRVKQDVLPGRYTTEWFEATKPGVYHLFCAEYCGNQHSGMIGEIVAMEPADYQSWLAGTDAHVESAALSGSRLFVKYSCNTCHGQRGPTLAGVYGSPRPVVEAGGKHETVTADDAYLRESIVNPSAKIVEGFQPLMPTFQGILTEEQVMDLVAYIKSLKDYKTQGGNP